jgi:molybdopterin-guanine dinucleotide biosynthesis protein A
LESVRLVVGPQADAAKGIVGRDDVGAIADWVVAWLKRRLLLGRDVMGAVMVGGQSRRMGADKAAMQFEGRSVLPRLVELLGGRLPEVWTIGRPVAVAGLPQCVRWHLDLRSGAGPLAGIATALRVARANGPRAVLAVACDMPALTGDVLDFLLEHRRPEKYATVLRNGQTGFLEPLAAVYEPRILEPIEQALDAGERSVVKLLESAGAHGVEVPAELAAALVNVNTPDELNVLRRNAQDTVYTDDPERI